jgi:hypothetical protein
MTARSLRTVCTAGAFLAVQTMMGCNHHSMRTATGTGGSASGEARGAGGSTSQGGTSGASRAQGSGGTTEISTRPDGAWRLDGPAPNQETNQPSEPEPSLDASRREDVAADAAPDGGIEGGVESSPVASLIVSPTSANFWVPSETAGPIVVTVSNVGAAYSGAFTIMMTGADADRFEITSTSCDQPLPPGGSCEVAVAFKHTFGAYYASLDLLAEGFPSGEFKVPLGGFED